MVEFQVTVACDASVNVNVAVPHKCCVICAGLKFGGNCAPAPSINAIGTCALLPLMAAEPASHTGAPVGLNANQSTAKTGGVAATTSNSKPWPDCAGLNQFPE